MPRWSWKEEPGPNPEKQHIERERKEPELLRGTERTRSEECGAPDQMVLGKSEEQSSQGEDSATSDTSGKSGK